MSQGPERVGTADIPQLATEVAEAVFRRGTLIEKREATTGKAGKWRIEHGLGVGSGKTLMVTMDGEKDLTGLWRHSSRLELKIVRGIDQVELKAVLMAPHFGEFESFEVDGQPSMDLGALADALAQAKKLMALDAKVAAEGTRARVRRATATPYAQAG